MPQQRPRYRVGLNRATGVYNIYNHTGNEALNTAYSSLLHSITSTSAYPEENAELRKQKEDYIKALTENKNGFITEEQRNNKRLAESTYCSDYFEYARDLLKRDTRVIIKSVDGSGLSIAYKEEMLFDDRCDFDLFRSRVYIGVPFYNFIGNDVFADTWRLNVGMYNTIFKFKVIGEASSEALRQESYMDINFLPSKPLGVADFKRVGVVCTNLDVSEGKDYSFIIDIGGAIAQGQIDGNNKMCLLQKIYNRFGEVIGFVNSNYVVSRRQINSRKPNTGSRKYYSKKHGNYVKHNIPFAVEIECHGKSEEAVANMSHAIPKEWGACRDGSLDTDVGYPIEIQSPILVGEKGEQNVIDVCNKLNEMGITAKDKSCGLHVHFGGGDMFVADKDVVSGKKKPTNTMSLFMFYRIFEDVIVSFLPSTRRKNRYCTTFKAGSDYQGYVRQHGVLTPQEFSKVESIKTLRDFERYWYGVSSDNAVRNAKSQRYTVTRYFGANIHSLLKENHFEVRFHSGTLNYEKILYWVNLHGRIVEMCGSGRINLKMLKKVFESCTTLESLSEKFFEILSLDDDTVEYLKHRQNMFKEADSKHIDEIVISKTKTLEII